MGARLVSLHYAFAEQDGFIIVEAPDEVDVTAAVIAAFIDRYNHEWLIERLGCRTPAEARAKGWRAAA